MTKRNSSKRAFLLSVVSMVLCFTMLMGTTFAWFTDTASSSGNKIQSGTLKVDLEVFDGTAWTSVKNNQTAIFTYDKWEPGYTEITLLKVENEGTLALKWYAKFVSESALGILADVIDVYVLPYGVLADASTVTYPADRDLAGYTRVGTVAEFVNTIETTTKGTLEAGEAAYLGIALKMQESAGNEYQGLSIAPFDIQIFATQLNSESDGFGPDYDIDAPVLTWDGTVGEVPAAVEGVVTIETPAQLAGLAAAVNAGNSYQGTTIKLGADINLDDIAWTPIGTFEANFNGSFYGNGYTIYNLNVSGTDGVGLFGFAGNAAHIEGVHIVNASVTGTHYVGTVLGYGYLAANCLKNCTVENATVTANAGENLEDGDKVGAVAGWASNGNITGNKAINCTVYGCRDIGGIIGYVNGENRAVTVFGNTVENVALGILEVENYNGDIGTNVNSIVGRIGTDVTIGENYGEITTAPGIEPEPEETPTTPADEISPVISAEYITPALNTYRVTGSVIEDDLDSVTVNGEAVAVDESGAFSIDLTIPQTSTTITVVAKDKSGNTTTETINASVTLPTTLADVTGLWGIGDESNPYLIGNAAELEWFAAHYMDGYEFNEADKKFYVKGTEAQYTTEYTVADAKYYKLTADIVWAENPTADNWTPIGWTDSPDYAYQGFVGHFNGAGYSISGIYQTEAYKTQGGGIFGYVAGTIENLTVEDSSFSGNRTCVIAYGPAHGYDLYIENCVVDGTVTVSGSGYQGNFTSVVASGATLYVTDCVNNANVSSTGVEVAGIVGYVNGTVNITGTTNNGTVTTTSTASAAADKPYIGGIVGWVNGSAYIKDSENNGDVSGTAFVGGIVGYATNSAIEKCINNAAIYASASSGYVGGIVGYAASGSTVSYCENHGTINGNNLVGGIAGYCSGGASFDHCYNDSDIVSGKGTGVGGIVGRFSEGTITNSINVGKITVSTTTSVLWGEIAGDCASSSKTFEDVNTTESPETATLSNCYFITDSGTANGAVSENDTYAFDHGWLTSSTLAELTAAIEANENGAFDGWEVKGGYPTVIVNE